MAKSWDQRAGMSLANLALVSVLVLEVICLEASAFPSLFNVRTHSIFRRQQQPNQQQQQQLQPQAVATNNLVGLANEQSFSHHQLGAGRPLPVDLMRISGGRQLAGSSSSPVNSISAHQLHQALLSSAASQPHQQRHFAFAESLNHDDQYQAGVPHVGSGFYMPQAAPVLTSRPVLASSIPIARQHSKPAGSPASAASTFELSDQTGDYFTSEPQDGAKPAEGSQLHLEPSHTSEIVDKIEQHIGQQVQHSLQQHAAASGYQQRAEKEAAPSEGHQEEGSAAVAGADEEEKLEKRQEGGGESGHKEPAESHHIEHPPEAFEVHHKKGGKSFQYFHMGHEH